MNAANQGRKVLENQSTPGIWHSCHRSQFYPAGSIAGFPKMFCYPSVHGWPKRPKR